MPEADEASNPQDIGIQADKRMRWLIAFAVMASAIMELVDTSAVNVSLPYMAGNLSSSVDEATWVLTSYLVANAMVLPLGMAGELFWAAAIVHRSRHGSLVFGK